MSQFQQPSPAGDQFKVSDHVGCLVLIYSREYRENIVTNAGTTDAVAADVHVLDGTDAGQSFRNTLIFGRALIPSLRGAIGGDPVLGRIGQGVAQPGKTAPWMLQPFEDADAAKATAWLAANPQGIAPAVQAAPHAYAPPADANGAAPAAPVQAPPVAAAPAGPPLQGQPVPVAAGGQVEVATLPPAVQELLKQSGTMPG